MSLLTVKVPEPLLKRLQALAKAQDLSIDDLVVEALENYTDADEDEPSKDELLQAIKENLQGALAGEGQDAFEALAELRQELVDDAD